MIGTRAYFKVMQALGNRYLRVDNRGQDPLVLDIALLEEATISYLGGAQWRIPRMIIEGLGRDQAAELVALLRRSGYRGRFCKSCGRLSREKFLNGDSSRCHVLFVRKPQSHWLRNICLTAERLGRIIPVFRRMLFECRKKHIMYRFRRSGYIF